MGKEMKAVISASLDAKGIAKGVQDANAHLAKLGKSGAATAAATSIQAAMTLLQATVRGIKSAATVATSRAEELTQIATQFNVGAANAETQRMVREFEDKRRIADAVAPGVIQATRERADAFTKQADRIVANRDALSRGIATVGSVTSQFEEGKSALADAALETAGHTRDIASMLRELTRKIGGQ